MIKKIGIVCLSFILVALTAQAVISGYTELAGTTDNYTLKDKDGIVDFSLVIPAMTSDELMNFDLARIISPENDTIDILSKQLVVPSNLSLPKQVESYFLSFTLDKPNYRAYVKDMGQYNLYGLSGSFPIKKVVDAYQNGQTIFEMINLFTFKGGGSELIEVKGPTKDIKIGINKWTFDTKNTITSPALAKNKEVLALSLFKIGDEYYPADMKRILSGKTETLINKTGYDNYVISVMMNNTPKSLFIDLLRNADGNIPQALFGERAAFDMSQVSYSIQKVTGTPVTAEFLPQIPIPQYTPANNLLTMMPPQTISGVQPYLMLVSLSEVATAGSVNLPLDFKNVLWNTYGQWQGSLTIPAQVKALIQPGKKYAWDVLYLATPNATTDTQIDWNKVTHVTRSTLTFTP